jgi:hypothetical protein
MRRLGATEDRFGDQNLAAGYCNRLKTRTKDDGGPLHEVATTTEQLAHRAFPALHEDQARHSLAA